MLFFWNLFYRLRQTCKDRLFGIKDFFYTRTHRPPDILTCEDTVRRILETGCSVSRFGDGEMKLIAGKDVIHQTAEPLLRQKLETALRADRPDLLVCLPAVFSRSQLAPRNDAGFWRHHLAYTRQLWYRCLTPGKTYGNAFISRNYMALKQKNPTEIAAYFDLIRQLWQGRKIVIVEGEQSRLGMGNDLFANAADVRRILCPTKNAFQKYDEILAAVGTVEPDTLILLALGATASVLAYDLCALGYQAVDIGNLDTEYEWFRMGATEKVPIQNKMVYEAGAGAGVGDAADALYLSQIYIKIF